MLLRMCDRYTGNSRMYWEHRNSMTFVDTNVRTYQKNAREFSQIFLALLYDRTSTLSLDLTLSSSIKASLNLPTE